MKIKNCLEPQSINTARLAYRKFLELFIDGSHAFRLTTNSEITPYARCFAIFGLRLLLDGEYLAAHSYALSLSIRKDLDIVRLERLKVGVSLSQDKPYLQLLAFSLSALFVLNQLKNDPLEDHVLPLLSVDVERDLQRAGSLNGVPSSGNQAMFLATLLCHAHEYLEKDVAALIHDWQVLHLSAINSFGFWGPFQSMSHLQFQNGYHQYEVLDYLRTKNVPWGKAADNIAALGDEDGHFAPYPGGGGCYDYDAVYVITGAGTNSVISHRDRLIRTAESILLEQNVDGGFCESHKIRPRSVSNLLRSAKHVYNSHGTARTERLRQSISLLRPKHDRIVTHWSKYSRHWSESDLWDSWFRMLTVARIDVALNPNRFSEWGFIDYPGIGFHSLFRHR